MGLTGLTARTAVTDWTVSPGQTAVTAMTGCPGLTDVMGTTVSPVFRGSPACVVHEECPGRPWSAQSSGMTLANASRQW